MSWSLGWGQRSRGPFARRSGSSPRHSPNSTAELPGPALREAQGRSCRAALDQAQSPMEADPPNQGRRVGAVPDHRRDRRLPLGRTHHDRDHTPAEAFPPGEYLRDELVERGWTVTEFAEIIGRPVQAVSEIPQRQEAITPDTALSFSEALGTSAEMWLNLQTAYQCTSAARLPTALN